MSSESGFIRVRTTLLIAIAAVAGSALLFDWRPFWTLPDEMAPPIVLLRLLLLILVIVAAFLVMRKDPWEAALTRQREAAAAIAESRLRFEALYNATLDAVLFLDATGRYVAANAAASELFGYTHEEILAKSMGDLSPPEGRERFLAFRRRISTIGKLRGESLIQTKDGRIIEAEFQLVSNLEPGLHAAFIHDITARKAAERAVQQLSTRLLQLQDDERRRIARQLHDTTAQNLAAVRLLIVRIAQLTAEPARQEALDEALALTEESINDVRTLSYLLHPPMIEEAGLMAALRWYAQGFEERTGVKVTLDFPAELERLPPELETSVFRIVQEALTNIQRHSGSTVATISIRQRADDLQLTIADEGRGMPPHLRQEQHILGATGVGIAGMRERARELGGSMHVESRGRGTAVVVTLPIRRA